MNGIERIAAERKRQVEKKGYSPEHDDEHVRGELAVAAACYAVQASGEFLDQDLWPWLPLYDKRLRDESGELAPELESHDQKIRLLEKAGALIAAEIDRLLRLGDE